MSALLVIYIAISMFMFGFAVSIFDDDYGNFFKAFGMGALFGALWLPLLLYSLISKLFMATPLYSYWVIFRWEQTKHDLLSKGRKTSLSRSLDVLLDYFRTKPTLKNQILIRWLESQRQEELYVE